MIKRSAYDKDMNFMKSYFGDQSKYHSFGFLFAAGVFTCLRIGNASDSSYSGTNNLDGDKYQLPIYSISLSFSVVGFLILFYAYSKIEHQCEWYDVLAIKKGAFSSLIAFLWFAIFFSAFRVMIYRKYDIEQISMNQYNSIEDYYEAIAPKQTLEKRMTLAFSIVVAVFNLGLSAYKNDLGPATVNLIIYLSNAPYVFNEGLFANQNKDFEKIWGLIMVLLSILICLFLIMQKRDLILKV